MELGREYARKICLSSFGGPVSLLKVGVRGLLRKVYIGLDEDLLGIKISLCGRCLILN